MSSIGTSISQATALLRSGGIVAIPTETVYGLAANGLDPAAVAKIFAAKERPSFDPLILHTDSITKIRHLVATIPDQLSQLVEEFIPGPLTIILPKTELVPDITTSGLPTVAVRIPDHPIALAVLRELDFPLAAPSANPFGYVSPTTAQHVADQLGHKVDYILDGGPCRVGLESTIVSAVNGKVHVHRKGGLALEAIEAIIGPVTIDDISSSNPSAPGMLHSHYATGTPIVLDDVDAAIDKYEPDRIGVLAWSSTNEAIPLANQRILSASEDMTEAASCLFRFMRELDTLDLDIIVAQTVPMVGLGYAINDKLRRAAYLEIA